VNETTQRNLIHLNLKLSEVEKELKARYPMYFKALPEDKLNSMEVLVDTEGHGYKINIDGLEHILSVELPLKDEGKILGKFKSLTLQEADTLIHNLGEMVREKVIADITRENAINLLNKLIAMHGFEGILIDVCIRQWKNEVIESAYNSDFKENPDTKIFIIDRGATANINFREKTHVNIKCTVEADHLVVLVNRIISTLMIKTP